VDIDLDRLVERARSERERWHVPGVALGILDRGRVETWADGLASLETREPVTAETRSRIASITKPFTATLAMTAVQDGLLSLDAPTRDGLTPRLLLSHQAGLACEWPEPLDRYGDGDDVLERLVKDAPEPGPSGSQGLFSYCNAGYWLVAASVAQRTGLAFETAMRERVLEPLGLTRTSFEGDDAATGHVQAEPGGDEHRVAESRYPRTRRPSGGLYSTVSDLLRFAAHHLGGPGPLSPESVGELQAPQVDAGLTRYGLGWSLRDVGEHHVVEHGGSALGYESLLLLVPAEQFALAALTNSGRGSAAILGIVEELGVAPVEPVEQPLESAELEALAGRYREQNGIITVAAENGRLAVDYLERDPFTGEEHAYPRVYALPIGERHFQVREGEARGRLVEFLEPPLARFDGVLFERVEE
jgi:CubicO group peptidase (beta-lactamase class C family)